MAVTPKHNRRLIQTTVTEFSVTEFSVTEFSVTEKEEDHPSIRYNGMVKNHQRDDGVKKALGIVTRESTKTSATHS